MRTKKVPQWYLSVYVCEAVISTRKPDGHRLLRTFMRSRGLSAIDIACRLKPPPARQAVTRWSNGARRPIELYQEQIATMTDGIVPVSSWLSKNEQEIADARIEWLQKHPQEKPRNGRENSGTTEYIHEESGDVTKQKSKAVIQQRERRKPNSKVEQASNGKPIIEPTEEPIDIAEFDAEEETEPEPLSDEDADADVDTDAQDVSTKKKNGNASGGWKNTRFAISKTSKESSQKPVDPSQTPKLPRHHGCSSDNPLDRIRNRREDRFEMISEDGRVLHVYASFDVAKEALDDPTVHRGAGHAVRCTDCKAVLAFRKPPSEEATESLVRAAYRSHHAKDTEAT